MPPPLPPPALGAKSGCQLAGCLLFLGLPFALYLNCAHEFREERRLREISKFEKQQADQKAQADKEAKRAAEKAAQDALLNSADDEVRVRAKLAHLKPGELTVNSTFLAVWFDANDALFGSGLRLDIISDTMAACERLQSDPLLNQIQEIRFLPRGKFVDNYGAESTLKMATIIIPVAEIKKMNFGNMSPQGFQRIVYGSGGFNWIGIMRPKEGEEF